MRTSRHLVIVVASLLGCTRTEPRAANAIELHASVRATIPHSPTAFTQGLAFWRGRLFEGTGMYGESRIRELDPRTGRELRHIDLEARYFGEGIAFFQDRLYQLTWREGVCLVYDPATLRRVEEIPYAGEGWGITANGTELITSDGSSQLSFRDPRTFRVRRTVTVVSGDTPVELLNELEFIDGHVWANVWLTDRIVQIDPASGGVVRILSTGALLPARPEAAKLDEVLNGIAFDELSQRMLVTGKRWPSMFDLDLGSLH